MIRDAYKTSPAVVQIPDAISSLRVRARLTLSAGLPLADGDQKSGWRCPGDYGRIAYVTTDGGLVAPPTDDMVRPARLLRAGLPATESAGHRPQA
jgi:hypothetical protein